MNLPAISYSRLLQIEVKPEFIKIWTRIKGKLTAALFDGTGCRGVWVEYEKTLTFYPLSSILERESARRYSNEPVDRIFKETQFYLRNGLWIILNEKARRRTPAPALLEAQEVRQLEHSPR